MDVIAALVGQRAGPGPIARLDHAEHRVALAAAARRPRRLDNLVVGRRIVGDVALGASQLMFGSPYDPRSTNRSSRTHEVANAPRSWGDGTRRRCRWRSVSCDPIALVSGDGLRASTQVLVRSSKPTLAAQWAGSRARCRASERRGVDRGRTGRRARRSCRPSPVSE